MSLPPPTEYAALRKYLDSPTPSVISDWPEFLHPHTPPDDAEWPAPREFSDIDEFLARLPWMQQKLCWLTMAAMLLDWLAHRDGGDPASRAEMQQKFAAVDAALAGTGDWQAAMRLGTNAFLNAGSLEDRYVTQLIDIVLNFDVANVYEFGRADDFFGEPQTTDKIFLARWWARCRCRLAVANAATVPFEWGVDRLLDVFRRDEFAECSRITRLIENCTDPAIVPVLVEMLDSGAHEFRSMAARILSRFGEAAAMAVPKMMDLLASERVGWVREVIELALPDIGEPVIPFAMELLTNGRWRARGRAARVLEQIGATAKPQLPALRERLAKESNERVRAALTAAIIAIESAATG